jgi:hypothetical protein
VFDRIVIVDWSAANTPKRGADSIWSYCTDDREPVNHPTRAGAFTELATKLQTPGRTLVGFDFPLGYPSGFAGAAGLDGEQPWSAAWRFLAGAVVDDERNRNNRWWVAAELNRRMGQRRFWGVPPRFASEHLWSRKVPITAEFRTSESVLRSRRSYPSSVWQLLGAGSVGSQTITGIPVVHRLRHHPLLAHRARVWPFETGLAPATGDQAIVIAEVWPSACSNLTSSMSMQAGSSPRRGGSSGSSDGVTSRHRHLRDGAAMDGQQAERNPHTTTMEGRMFVQMIKGRTNEAARLQALADKWRDELRPGAVGFLGGTGGVADDGTFVLAARFEDEAAARANSDRPEQAAWWEAAADCFDGEPRFYESSDVDLMLDGGSDAAGFVQVMEGRVLDRARVTALETEEMMDQLRAARPDVIGGVRAWFDDDRYAMFIYFDSEEAARKGESSDRFAGQQSEYDSLFTDVSFIDLRRPIYT